jgi:hypothetical protein
MPSIKTRKLKIADSISPQYATCKKTFSTILSLYATKQSSSCSSNVGTDTTILKPTVHTKWNEAFERLVHYKEEFGHTNVPPSYNNGGTPHLGRWVGYQRYSYRKKTLNMEKIQKLESLGLSWTGVIFHDRWQSCFARLLKFHEKYGHVDVGPSYNDGENTDLGSWLHFQRHRYMANTLSHDKIKKLESLGVTWKFNSDQISNFRRDEGSWLSAFERLKDFKNIYGHTNVPHRFNDDKEPQLGDWVGHQRKAFQIKKLTNGNTEYLIQERKDLLNSLGFVWDLGRQPEYDSTWMVHFENVKAFKNKYNTTKIGGEPSGIRDTLASISRWAHTQRRLYNKFMANETTAITQERIDLLNSIGFAWNLQNKTLHEKWLHRYLQLYWYHSQHNNTNVTLSSGCFSEFVHWVSIQKIKYQEGKLDQGKIDLMNELNFDWEPDPSASWEDMFEELSQYKQKFGSTLVNKRINRELGDWTAEIRQLYATGDLDTEWVRRLNFIEFKWDGVDVEWNAMFDRLVAYKAKHNSVCVPRLSQDDRPLGFWVSKVRTKHRKFLNEYGRIDEDMIPEIAEIIATTKIPVELSVARLRRLHSLGFVWDPREAKWLEIYERLLKYKEKYNSTLVPEGYDPDPQLANWVNNQRSLINKHSTARFVLLDEIGFEWDPYAEVWKGMYGKLREYKEAYGNALIPQTYKACPELGIWVSRQRQMKKLGLLDEERIQALDLLGFVWSVRNL